MPRVLLQRDTELACLGRQLGDVRTGTGRLILVDGPAGIGKSSLLLATIQTAQASGIRTLRASGSPLEQDAGWGIARQLFAPVRGVEWDQLAVGAAALARRALDADDEEPVRGGDAMHAATHGLTWLASGLAERGPTLMVVDDVHWADAPSLRWLAGLARQLPELPLALLCAVRTGEPTAEPDLLEELLAIAPEPPVRPGPLTPDAVATVVSQRLPTAGPAFARACHTATAGNPFLVGALLNHVVAERLEPTDELATTLSAFGPEQVARSVRRQLTRLPSGSKELVQAFAVLGRSAPLRHARELAGLGPDAAARLADTLRAAGLLDRDGDQWFLVHPLVAGALYAGLAPGEAGVWHGRAARLFAAERADPETVALHLLHTEPGRDDTTVATLREAADRATIRGAPQSAAVFLRRALAEPPLDPAIEAEVRGDLGLALAAHLDPEAPAHLAEATRLAATPDQRSRIALSGARALGLVGYFAEAADLCRAGLERPEGITPDRLARLEVELAGNLWLDRSTVEESRARARAHSPGAEALWQVAYACNAAFDGAPASEPRALLASAVGAGILDDDPDSIMGSCARFLMTYCGDLAAAEAHCTALIELARPRGWQIALAHGSFLRALALARAGRILDAEADARLGFELKARYAPLPALGFSAFIFVDTLVELDEFGDAERVLARMGVLMSTSDAPLGGPFAVAHLLESRGRLRLAQHRPVDAHADLRAAGRYWREFGAAHPGLSAWRVDDAEALASLGDRAAARTLAEEHLDLADRVGLPAPRGAGLRALARTTGAKESIDLLEQAAELLTDAPERLEYTRVLVDLGTALRRGSQREAARDPLRRALALAERGGMRLLARRARQELDAAGARPRRTSVTGVDSLTSAEHRVAALAAQGFSNPEIAQRLYVTRRTVETHLTHVYAKLGVTTRTELATCLAGHV